MGQSLHVGRNCFVLLRGNQRETPPLHQCFKMFIETSHKPRIWAYTIYLANSKQRKYLGPEEIFMLVLNYF